MKLPSIWSEKTVIEEFQFHKGNYIFLIKSSLYEQIHEFMPNCGWGNGYVALFNDNRFYEKSYDDIMQEIDLNVELTFSEKDNENNTWVVGFDTAHSYNKGETREIVLAETKKLSGILSAYAITTSLIKDYILLLNEN